MKVLDFVTAAREAGSNAIAKSLNAQILASVRPVNNICADCPKLINPTAERHYIVVEAGEYRRQCAKCHDKHATPVSHTSGHAEMPIR